MIGVILSHTKHDEKYVVTLHNNVYGCRFKNGTRPDTAYVFEVHNMITEYTEKDKCLFKDIFYSQIIGTMHPINNIITFQDDRIKKLVISEEMLNAL